MFLSYRFSLSVFILLLFGKIAQSPDAVGSKSWQTTMPHLLFWRREDSISSDPASSHFLTPKTPDVTEQGHTDGHNQDSFPGTRKQSFEWKISNATWHKMKQELQQCHFAKNSMQLKTS